MTGIRLSFVIAFAVSFVVGCASTPAGDKSASGIPAWVMTPLIENGFADTQCVLANASMGILKSKATALGRAEISKQIDVQVKAMDKTYQSLVEATEGDSVGNTFESVSKQVSSQKLSGSRATKVEYVDFPDGTQQLCVMVTLDPALTRELYNEVTKSSGRKLSGQNDAVLWQQFMAQKAQKELDAELSRRN